MDKESVFSKEYRPKGSTQSFKIEKTKKHESIEPEIEIKKYGINKPVRQIIRAKVIND